MASRLRESRLRERRLECGLTQSELAERAGVSRQLVAAVEAGRNAPAVDAALGLARALATSVEALFSDHSPEIVSVLGGALRDGFAVRVGRVGDQLVGAELDDHGVAGAGWAQADGVLHGGSLELFPGARPAGCVLAGCDPAAGVAEAMLSGRGARSLVSISAPTGAALDALGRNRVHGAVVHNQPHQLPRPPVPVARWHLARWESGLGVPRRLRGHSLQAIFASGLPLVRRQPAAASQQAADRALAAAGIEAPPSGPQAAGHLDAARIAAILGGVAVTTEGAARAFGLAFIGLETHVVEVWINERWHDHPGVTALAEVLASCAFTARVAHFGGYDLNHCGASLQAA